MNDVEQIVHRSSPPACCLVRAETWRIIGRVNEKRNIWLPVLLMIALAVTRWPGVLPPNFSAVYGLVFCAGVYFPPRLWWIPTLTMVVSDLALNFYYALHFEMNPFQPMQLMNYAVYAILFVLGRRLGRKASFLRLLAGGILGALIFYLLTNTAAWFFNPFGNPEYTRNLMGWLIALTKGTAGYQATWEFLRNTLLSGGLFTGLFVGAMKLTADAESPREKELAAPEDKPAEEPVGEEADAKA
jgi:hypothetical protein